MNHVIMLYINMPTDVCHVYNILNQILLDLDSRFMGPFVKRYGGALHISLVTMTTVS